MLDMTEFKIKNEALRSEASPFAFIADIDEIHFY
jgi:hypothetical protein